MGETWRVTGVIDRGAVSFPAMRRITVVFSAADWHDALAHCGGHLAAKGNGLTPVVVESVVRTKPPIRPV